MFFANPFSYRQRKRLCALAFTETRRSLAARLPDLAPTLAQHGIRVRQDRLSNPHRHVADAVRDPRPLHARPARPPSVRSTARDLERALDDLESYVVDATYRYPRNPVA
jgi:NTE family protein